jgi:hypothetical protein
VNVRRLRYPKSSNVALARNAAHQFASRHALSIYGARAIYSFIPKNGCSTLRYTVARANGCIDGPSDINWIHSNNLSFSATLRELLTAQYTFVVLRCPYSRLASVFLDKIVDGNLRPEQQKALLELGNATATPRTGTSALRRKVQRLADLLVGNTGRTDGSGNAGGSARSGGAGRSGATVVPGLAELSFRDFVSLIGQRNGLQTDHHWSPQSAFLVYEDYDDIFRLEAFAEARARLAERIGLEVQDARGLTLHGTDRYQMDDTRCFADVPGREIAAMRQAGRCPSHAALYDATLVARVGQLYADDVAIYAARFGTSDLLFR